MRKLNSLKNFITSVVPFVILMFLGFWKVNVWQSTLNIDIYALNQLFFQLFAYLSLAEAGIGSLVQKEYYKLLALDKKDDICAYYTLSKQMLRKVCYIILIGGFVLSFFLKILSNDNGLSLIYMQTVFMLFLLKSVSEYFMFSPRFVLQADQKLYKVNVLMNFYKVAEGLLEIFLIMYGFDFMFVLIITFFVRVTMNWRVNAKVYKEYPWLKDVKDTKDFKITGLGHVFIYKIVSSVQDSTDIMLISILMNTTSVAIYSNYKYVTKYLNDFIYLIGTSITSSMGNLMYGEDKQKSLHVFETINALFLFIGTLLSTTLWFSLDSFIALWVGSDKVMGGVATFCMIYMLFHNIVRRPFYIVKDVFALYKESQLIGIIEGIINIVLSICLIRQYGVVGVVIATSVATILTNFWFFPYLIYRNIYEKGFLANILQYITCFGTMLLLFFLSQVWKEFYTMDSYATWFLFSILYAVVVFIILFIFFYIAFNSFRELTKQTIEFIVSILKRKSNHEKIK